MAIRHLAVLLFVACFLLSLVIGFASICTFLFLTLVKERLRALDRGHRRRVLLPLSPDLDERPLFILGFFHPYCNAGGGGERVLWTTIRDVQSQYPHIVSVVYTGDTEVSKLEILEKVKARFNIVLNPQTISFEHLYRRGWVEDSRYPYFTLLGQSLGSLILGWEAINKVIPDIFFDTMGYAFTYPMIKLITDAKVAAYVHYPTISSDMLKKVQERSSQYNNNSAIAKNPIWSFGKLIYYRAFAKVYGLCGSFADIAVVNSTWTKGHIDELWHTDSTIIYPPCDTDHLVSLPLQGRERFIVSVAQFRPEKDHLLQLRAFKILLDTNPSFWDGPERVELVLIGSSRNQSDENRIADLKDECVRLAIHNNVQFVVNATFPELVTWLGRARIGLHTMWNEHFGIGVVEYMAAGLIPVVHSSGGPKMDIVVDYNGKRTGYLATDAQDFADALLTVLWLPDAAYREIAENARAAACDKFSELEFREGMLRSLRRWIDV